MKVARLDVPVAIAVLSICLAGCSSSPKTGYYKEERAITTRGGLGENGIFHDVLYNPESIALSFPGYIVGIDKGRRHAVGKDAIYPEPVAQDQPGLGQVKRRMRSDPKIHYISHIVRNEGRAYGQGNCVIYSMYSKWGGDDPEGAGHAPARLCPDGFFKIGAAQTAHVQSWEALKLFQAELHRAIEVKTSENGRGYTHVVVMVMGWNTPQIEAVQNFNAIGSHLRTAAGTEHFDPLFIGITWPSVWSSEWLDPFIKIVSYRAKAHDADEVGTIWISEVIDTIKSVMPAQTALVGIGHSFGARALFSAVCGESVWKSDRVPTRKWDVLIGWSPAFSIRRLTPQGSRDGFTYAQGCLDRSGTIVVTASVNDTAVDSAFWADMASSVDQWTTFCLKPESKTGQNSAAGERLIAHKNCISKELVPASGAENLVILPGRLNYLDASRVVRFAHPNTGGGAHSDIYRAIHGQINWKAASAMEP